MYYTKYTKINVINNENLNHSDSLCSHHNSDVFGNFFNWIKLIIFLILCSIWLKYLKEVNMTFMVENFLIYYLNTSPKFIHVVIKIMWHFVWNIVSEKRRIKNIGMLRFCLTRAYEDCFFVLLNLLHWNRFDNKS